MAASKLFASALGFAAVRTPSKGGEISHQGSRAFFWRRLQGCHGAMKMKRGDEALIQATHATLEKLGIAMHADRFPGSARSRFDGSSQVSGRGTVQLGRSRVGR